MVADRQKEVSFYKKEQRDQGEVDGWWWPNIRKNTKWKKIRLNILESRQRCGDWTGALNITGYWSGKVCAAKFLFFSSRSKPYNPMLLFLLGIESILLLPLCYHDMQTLSKYWFCRIHLLKRLNKWPLAELWKKEIIACCPEKIKPFCFLKIKIISLFKTTEKSFSQPIMIPAIRLHYSVVSIKLHNSNRAIDSTLYLDLIAASK